MTVSLTDVQSGTRAAPPRILVYGIEGIGKSTFASKFPKPIFIQTEDGLDNIDCESFPVARKFEDVVGALDALIREKHDYSTVVIDSLDWLEALIWKMLCEREGVESIEQIGGGYAKGYVQALTHWRRVVEKLQTLRLDKGCAIVLTAHAKIEFHDDPETAKFQRFAPQLHRKAYSLLAQWVDVVFFATRSIGAARGEGGGGDRVLRALGTSQLAAKRRYEIADDLPMDADVVLRAICDYQAGLAKG